MRMQVAVVGSAGGELSPEAGQGAGDGPMPGRTRCGGRDRRARVCRTGCPGRERGRALTIGISPALSSISTATYGSPWGLRRLVFTGRD